MRAILLFLYEAFVFLLFLNVSIPVFAMEKSKEIHAISATIDSTSQAEGAIDKAFWNHLTIISDSRINALIDDYVTENKRKGGMDGYRVQIYSGNKDGAFKLKSQFISRFPEHNVHIIFQTPEFYVRVGDFRTPSEAIKLLHTIEREFRDPFIIEDVIQFPELKTTDSTMVNPE
jgi:hypothetical protein